MFPIKFNQHFFILSLAAIVSGAMLLPNRVSAFWPFSTNADAATTNTSMPSSATPILRATLNSNPNSSAPIALATSGGALVSRSGPDGTPADIISAPPPDRISVYPVRPGDTLSDIADMFGVSVNTIIWANNLKNAQDIHPNDTLVILPVSGIEYTVAKGDTLKSLAKKYGADADEVAKYNGLDPAAPLKIGSAIIIIGGELVVPAPSVRSSGSSSAIRQSYLGCGGPVRDGYYGNPVPGGLITQGLHGCNGIDLGAARGTPVYAAANGVVIISRSNGAWNGGYGNYVVITHGNGSQTLYSHMRSAIVGFGQMVSRGQLIGYVGATGKATGAHLHFEVRGAANPFRNCSVGSVCSPQ